MNRRHFLYTPALLGARAGYAASETASTIKTRIAKATAAALAMQRRDWEQGTLAQAFLEAGDHANVILLTKAAMVLKTPDGRLGVVGSGSATDPAMAEKLFMVTTNRAHARRPTTIDGIPFRRSATNRTAAAKREFD